MTTTITRYIPSHCQSSSISTPYLLLEYIDPSVGCMLSNAWDQHHHDGAYRRTLFRGMARLMLALARVPQPRIGSFIFNPDDCTVTLGYRPLTCGAMIIESEEMKSKHNKEAFACTDAFVADMLALHDEAFIKNPNAIFDKQDCQYYMATRLLVRAFSGSFIEPYPPNDRLAPK